MIKTQKDISEIALDARNIADFHDIFSGEELSRTPLIKTWEKSRPYDSVVLRKETYIFEVGEGGKLYCVRFNCKYEKELREKLESIVRGILKKQETRLNKKRLTKGDIGILMQRFDREQKRIIEEIINFYTLGSCGAGELSRHNLGDYYQVVSKYSGLFITGQRNLRKRTTLTDMMQSSAISQPLKKGIELIDNDYEDIITHFLNRAISVESERIHNGEIIQAYT